MDKKEAYELYIKLSDECAKRADCYTCPFFIQGNEMDMCILEYVAVSKVVNRVLALLAKQEQRASISPEKDGRIIISGKLKENPEEKPSEALARAGSIIAQEIKADIAKHDNVNSPAHYCKGGLECIEVIKAQLTHEQRVGYLYGNIIKYMWRWPDKNGLEDLQKAAKYLEWLQEEVKK